LKSLTWGTYSLFFIFGALICGVAAATRPFGFNPFASACMGLSAIAAASALAIWLLRVRIEPLVGGFLGTLAGCLLGCFVDWALVLIAAQVPASRSVFVPIAIPLLLAYVGMVIGTAKSSDFAAMPLPGPDSQPVGKLLDTSVLIDGRISDVVQCGFLEGPLVVPRFVLHELQVVADSADAARRARGRRGLDVVQHLQSLPDLKIEVSTQDFPSTREVDLKLIEFAKLRAAKIVTNDFNLNKLAQVQGVQVLNINQLASSLKPIVLPGELMRVFILKEGKEHNQGIAYLEDGTMVVVDNARRLISKHVDIVVTSVLQTTAGKMIFGRYDERAQAEARPISASAGN